MLYTHVICVISFALIKCRPNYTVVQDFPRHPGMIFVSMRPCTTLNRDLKRYVSSLSQWGWLTVNTVPNMFEVIPKTASFLCNPGVRRSPSYVESLNEPNHRAVPGDGPEVLLPWDALEVLLLAAPASSHTNYSVTQS